MLLAPAVPASLGLVEQALTSLDRAYLDKAPAREVGCKAVDSKAVDSKAPVDADVPREMASPQNCFHS